MEHFLISANTVVPFFFVMALGWGVVKIRLVGDQVIDGLNRLVFFVFLPTNLFGHLYRADLTTAFDPKLVVYCVVATVVAFLITWLVAGRFIERAKLGTVVQAGYRGNYIIMATPMIALLMGEAALPKAVLMAPFFVSTYSTLAAILFISTAETNKQSPGKMIPSILLGLLKTPIFLGVMAGLLVNFSGLRLPVMMERSVDHMVAITIPAALLGIGGTLRWDKVRRHLKLAATAMIIKNVAMPLALIVPAVFFGFRELELAIVAIAALSPTAIVSYATAKNMGGDGDLAASCLVFSNATALFTIVPALTILRLLHLM
ncbi:MAG: AEC family transporter [Oscillospiraceae bacterium]|nr:AEC family transporter [Oscillospiraceae bacterium]